MALRYSDAHPEVINTDDMSESGQSCKNPLEKLG
jgi:hypothetical protein